MTSGFRHQWKWVNLIAHLTLEHRLPPKDVQYPEMLLCRNWINGTSFPFVQRLYPWSGLRTDTRFTVAIDLIPHCIILIIPAISISRDASRKSRPPPHISAWYSFFRWTGLALSKHVSTVCSILYDPWEYSNVVNPLFAWWSTSGMPFDWIQTALSFESIILKWSSTPWSH